MNGASDLMAQISRGPARRARPTVGVGRLSLDAVAGVEALFEIAP